MSRLDSVIRRLQAQRICLDWATQAVAGRPGAILELGLGNGRTYDHLRQRCPEREIYAFERQLSAHPDCVPDDDHLFLGDLVDTLPAAARKLGRCAILVHCDIGTGDAARNARVASRIGPLIGNLVRPDGIVLSDQRLPVATAWQELALPDGVAAGRYFLYRVRARGGAE